MAERIRLELEPKAPASRKKLIEVQPRNDDSIRGIPGPKSNYDPKTYPKTAQFLARRGAVQSEIADCFGVTTRTLQNWIALHPEMAEAISAGNDVFNPRVERSLAEQAIGFYADQYTWRETTKEEQKKGAERFELIPVGRKYIPPNVAATIFFLKNRMPDQWRDVQQHVVQDNRLQTPDEILGMIRDKIAQFQSEGFLKTLDLTALPAPQKRNGKGNGHA